MLKTRKSTHIFRIWHLIAWVLYLISINLAYCQISSDDEIFAAAKTIVPADITEQELKEILRDGLWYQDTLAVAISIPLENKYLTFVFRHQPDGTYSAKDVSWVAKTAFGFWGFPEQEIDKFETKPMKWHANGEYLFVQIRTRGWRKGQRYTVSGNYLVAPDGSVTGQ